MECTFNLCLRTFNIRRFWFILNMRRKFSTWDVIDNHCCLIPATYPSLRSLCYLGFAVFDIWNHMPHMDSWNEGNNNTRSPCSKVWRGSRQLQPSSSAWKPSGDELNTSEFYTILSIVIVNFMWYTIIIVLFYVIFEIQKWGPNVILAVHFIQSEVKLSVMTSYIHHRRRSGGSSSVQFWNSRVSEMAFPTLM